MCGFFLNIAPVWQNFKIKHPFETSCVHSCAEKKGKLVWWSKTILSLFIYSIYFLVHHFKTSLIINSKLLIREQKSCTIWNICEEDSFIKIFHCFFHKEGRKWTSERHNLYGLFFKNSIKAKCSIDLAWSGKVTWFENLNVTFGFIC